MNESLLIVDIAGRRVAFPAEKVGSVVELGDVTPVPRAPDHVSGLLAVRSRALTVIDCAKSIGIGDYDPPAERQAVEIEKDGYPYALVVDVAHAVVDRQDSQSRIPGGAGDGWERVATEMVETAIGPALLCDIDALIEGPEPNSDKHPNSMRYSLEQT